MKKLFKFPVAAMLVLCCVLFSCNQKEDLSVNNSDSPMLKKGGVVITVSPSGNYEDDSYNIQTALNNAVVAGPGTTVKLTAGTFYLKYKIEIDGFDGYIKGAGKQKTILTTHDKIDFTGEPFSDNWCLITFRHGYVRMSDLTFNITEPEPYINADDFENALSELILVTGNSCAVPFDENDQMASSFFNNVEFIAGEGNWYGYNVGGFLWIGADCGDYITGGNQKITNCLFQGSVNCLSNWLDKNSTWLVGGNGSSGNVFKDAMWPLTMGESFGLTAEISYNKFINIHDLGAIFISQGYFSDASDKTLCTFLIQQNDIEIIEGDGITIADISNEEGYGKTIDAVIKSNQIYMNSEGFWGGIFGYFADDIIVKSNKIWGNGIAGIYCGLFDMTTNWFMQGNNVQNVNAWGAPIWLGEGTSYYTVIGGSNKTNVFDQGTNNILTGVTPIQGNDLGQEAQEAHELLKEIMQNFKNH